MKYFDLKRTSLVVATITASVGLAVVPASALGNKTKVSAANTSTTSSTTTANQQAKLQLIITRGNAEITRRLAKLAGLSSTIAGATKLSASDKAALSSEVSSEISGLNSLKTTLDAETTVAGAKTDAQSIINDYRVYALVVPKVMLVRAADAQQVAESKLSTLAAKLQTQITTDKTAGKDTASLQTSLDDMTSKINAAQTISTTIESSVINLQPSDYNSNHSVLSGDRDQLKTAQTDITAAITDGKTVISGLQSL